MFGRTWVLISLALAMITGCGGGGGGGGGDRTINESVQAQESATSFVPIEGTVQSIDFVTGDSLIRLTQSVQGVQLEVPELENDAFARFKVVSEADGKTINTFLSITAINTSALPLLARLDAFATAPDQSAVQDDVRLTRILVELEYLAGNYTIADRNRFLEEYLASFNTVLASFIANTSGLSSVTSDYREGTVNEDDLARVLTEAEASLSNLSIAGDLVFDDMRDVLVALGVILPDDPGAALPLVYDTNQGRYTRFTNISLGSYENGQWLFSPEFDFLNSALLLSTLNASNGSN